MFLTDKKSSKFLFFSTLPEKCGMYTKNTCIVLLLFQSFVTTDLQTEK